MILSIQIKIREDKHLKLHLPAPSRMVIQNSFHIFLATHSSTYSFLTHQPPTYSHTHLPPTYFITHLPPTYSLTHMLPPYSLTHLPPTYFLTHLPPTCSLILTFVSTLGFSLPLLTCNIFICVLSSSPFYTFLSPLMLFSNAPFPVPSLLLR